MKKFKIEIIETSNLVIEVEDNSLEEAIKQVRELYDSGNIIVAESPQTIFSASIDEYIN